jgi:D-amino-acid dehydrogenase
VKQLGVTFRYGCDIQELVSDGKRITGVQLRDRSRSSDEVLKADSYVLAMGSYAPQLLRTAGHRATRVPGEGLLNDHSGQR